MEAGARPKSSSSLAMLVVPLAASAAVEVAITGPPRPPMIAIGLAALAVLVPGAVAALLLRALRAVPTVRGRPVLAATLAAWPAILAPAYMAFHDVKYDVLGPFPSRPLVWGARAGVAGGSLAVAAALVALSRRPGPRLAAAALLVLSPAAASYRARPSPPGGPALLLLTIDTLRADHLGAYGHPLALTPHLDRLARRGRLHENAICQIPITTPSHASILTGRYPPGHAVRAHAYSMDPAVPLLTEALAAAGFATAAVVAAYPLDSKFGLSRGFSLYDDELTSRSGLAMARLLDAAWPVPRIERAAADVNARALPWLEVHGRGRYFLWVHYFDPHGPYEPVPPYGPLYLDRMRDLLPAEPAPDDAARQALAGVLGSRGSGDVRDARLGYLGEVAETDRAAGILIGSARARRAGDDLTVVAMSDHGESLTEHGAYFRHGEDLYEPSLRIPMLAAGPGIPCAIHAGLTETVDVAPLLAAAAGVAWTPARKDRPAAYAESTSASVGHVPRKVLAARSLTHKLVRGAADRREELYDLETDPGEQSGLAADDGSREALAALLEAYEAAAPEAAAPADVDRETIEKLRALGYLK